MPAPDMGPLEGKVAAVRSRDDVPLEHHAPELHVAPGDWALASERVIALVSAEEGTVFALGLRGGRSALETLAPVAFDGLSEIPGEVETIEPALDGRALHIVKRLSTEPLTQHVWLGLRGDVLLVQWRLVAQGDVTALTMGEQVFFGNTPTWVEGHGFIREGGSHGGAFLARESLGVSYAFCREGGRVMARFRSPELAGFHRSARTGEHVISLRAGEISPLRSVALAVARGTIGDAVAALPCAPAARTVALPSAQKLFAGARIEITSCESELARQARLERASAAARPSEPAERGAGAPFLRYDGVALPSALLVPAECARARVTGPGYAPGAWIDPARSDAQGWGHPDVDPRAGAIAWRIRDRDGAVLPATLVVRGEGETPDPDWGDDAFDGAARNYLYTTGDGERLIPPGRYRVLVHRGFEHTLAERRITVKANANTTIEAELERVVDTRGWISADLHVHALPSPDAPTLLEDRVRSLAAVGVEVAVATDHNAVTDYRPAIEKLALTRLFASIIGDEVTTAQPYIGHFNVFPLAANSEPLVFRHALPAEVFTAARAASPGGVLQVNHPRMGDIGYFELFRLDRGDVPRWAEEAKLAALGFDAIEIFNGDHYAEREAVERVMRDWYALLDAGMRYTATGNSDSHKIGYQEAGVPRNYVALADDDPARFDAGAFTRAVREGRVVVSSGPFIDVRAGEAQPGGSIDAGVATITVRVDAPPWIDLREVELVRRGEAVRRWKIDGKARPRLSRPRLSERVQLTLASGDWLLCVARGEAAMEPLFRHGSKPFAFTNPIWVK